jgi:ABC-2 type transport system ATP-binding protein
MIEVSQLRKSFGNARVLDAVTFELDAGACVWLSGDAGAGKTTLLRLLATLVKPTSGTIRIAGYDAARHLAEARRHVVLSDASLTGSLRLRVDEYLTWLASAGTRTTRASATPHEAARRADLVPARRIDALDRQQRAALTLAAAAVVPAAVLLIDDAVDFFAARQRQALMNWMSELREGGATLICTSRRADTSDGVWTHAWRLAHGRLFVSAAEDASDAVSAGAGQREGIDAAPRLA